MRQNYGAKLFKILLMVMVLMLFGVYSAGAKEPAMADQDQITMSKIRQTDSRISIGPVALSRIQKTLADKGFSPGAVDGVWGARTSTAVKNFQVVQNIIPTGTLNIETIRALGLSEILTGSLDELSAKDLDQKNLGKNTQIFLSPFSVYALQQSLGKKGISAGPEDGVFGKKTRAAVREFKSQKGLEPNRRVSLSTLERLGLNQVTANLGFEGNKYTGTSAASASTTMAALQPAEGSVEAQTVRGYFAEPGSRKSLSTGAPLFAGNDFVRQVQTALVGKGYYPGQVDGKWGEWTSYAVGIFQMENKLPRTGYLTLATINKLLQ